MTRTSVGDLSKQCASLYLYLVSDGSNFHRDTDPEICVWVCQGFHPAGILLRNNTRQVNESSRVGQGRNQTKHRMPCSSRSLELSHTKARGLSLYVSSFACVANSSSHGLASSWESAPSNQVWFNETLSADSLQLPAHSPDSWKGETASPEGELGDRLRDPLHCEFLTLVPWPYRGLVGNSCKAQVKIWNKAERKDRNRSPGDDLVKSSSCR